MAYPAEILRQRARVVPRVDDGIRTMLGAMQTAMLRGGGIGLAAPQVGLPLRMFVSAVPGDERRVFVNPEIADRSRRSGRYRESCLSFPGIEADIHRPVWVRVRAWDENGVKFQMLARGLLARAVQHELDHLNGVLFLDHVEQKKRERLLRRYETAAATVE